LKVDVIIATVPFTVNLFFPVTAICSSPCPSYAPCDCQLKQIVTDTGELNDCSRVPDFYSILNLPSRFLAKE